MPGLTLDYGQPDGELAALSYCTVYGDLAIVRDDPQVAPGAIAVCYVGPEQEVTVKRLWERRDGFELRPENRAHRPLRVPKDDADFRIGGPVIGLVRQLR